MRIALAIILTAVLSLQACESAPAETTSVVGVWDGTIGNQAVRMCVNSDDSGGAGNYYYRSHLQALPLTQSERRSGVFVESFDESDAKAPRWTFEKIEADALNGQWSSGSRKLPIRLTRVPGLRLKEDETPCGSMLFQGPRLAGIKVVSKPATKDGVRYTRLILDDGGHFGDAVKVESFALIGDGPATRAINARLREPLAGEPNGWLACVKEALHDGETKQKLSPRMFTRRWLSLMDESDWFCASAYPNYDRVPRTFDLQTGREVDLLNWLNAKAVKVNRDDYGELKSLRPAFRSVILRGWKAKDSDCELGIRSEDVWYAELTRTGFIFTPNLPHVVAACSEEFRMSFATLRPWLNDEGRRQVATFEAEVAKKR